MGVDYGFVRRLCRERLSPDKVEVKNWLFIGHPNVCPRAAALFILAENCRIAGIRQRMPGSNRQGGCVGSVPKSNRPKGKKSGCRQTAPARKHNFLAESGLVTVLFPTAGPVATAGVGNFKYGRYGGFRFIVTTIPLILVPTSPTACESKRRKRGDGNNGEKRCNFLSHRFLFYSCALECQIEFISQVK